MAGRGDKEVPRTLVVRDETHTLACMLRERLERNHPDEFVGCSVTHPLDTFLTVRAPSVAAVRLALLQLIDQVAVARREVEGTSSSHA